MCNSNHFKIPLTRLADIWREAGYPKPLSLFMANLHKYNSNNSKALMIVSKDSHSQSAICLYKNLEVKGEICLYKKPFTSLDYFESSYIPLVSDVIDVVGKVIEE